MQELTMFYLPDCPHCRLALKLMDALKAEDPRYAAVSVRKIDERANKALADAYDYWYVPCFFLDGKKLFEGHMEKDDVRAVFDAATSGMRAENG